MHSDKTWAETFQAGVVLVAGGLVDHPFAPQWRILGGDRKAVGLVAAVTATLTYLLVDKHPFLRILQ